MFYLALTFGLETDPLGALARMAGFVEESGRKKGIAESLWMTVGVSDGQSIWAVRYASDGDAPTLYHSREMDEVYELYPQLAGRLSLTTRLVVSEPLGTIAEAWQMVPQNSSVRVNKGDIEVLPFVPIAPTTESLSLAGTL
jgi:glutamine amidotransferase